MVYQNIQPGSFVSRPNRFIAYVETEGKTETVHVKNTGRCAELLVPGARVYLEKSGNPQRKTQWDLVAVEKGERMINMDSQAPNQAVREWLEKGGLFPDITLVRPESTYKHSRFDFYVEHGGKKTYIEVKGVTLEEDGIVRFPDAPSDRAVKHLEELCQAEEEGFETLVLFVIQMEDVRFFTPNRKTHPAFADALAEAAAKGVNVRAFDCQVTADSMEIGKEVPVVLEDELLFESVEPLVEWFRKNSRDLPWRKHISAYRVWVSEIMLQQTRVEAVKPYFERFMRELPTVESLAEAPEDRLLKLWEGLGYYNRVRNMQKAARQIVEEYGGKFPETYEEIHSLTGIGSYTAGAISSFAFGIPRPAVDGNVLRVVSRLLAETGDITKASVKKNIEERLEKVIPADCPSDFNQGLIELGALVCVPNGEPKCGICPLAGLCRAKKLEIQMELPVKKKAKERRIENRTILVIRDGDTIAIRKRPAKGLLAGMYEFPGAKGHLTMDEAVDYSRRLGLTPLRVQELGAAKHIFSHVEWHMTGYQIWVDELAERCTEEMIFARLEEIEERYSMPAAFAHYTRQIKNR